jgi:hypothetical protein
MALTEEESWVADGSEEVFERVVVPHTSESAASVKWIVFRLDDRAFDRRDRIVITETIRL